MTIRQTVRDEALHCPAGCRTEVANVLTEMRRGMLGGGNRSQ